ncbi:UBX domain-containing protein 10 [Sorex araneus]|uniref:UBX domain-containing protein 10 n=1 Tax=Sorex araneus TaxID=42254 RepID=UPI0001580AB1|nr:UBX domain-containing protein 10 [Sorex araneus]
MATEAPVNRAPGGRSSVVLSTSDSYTWHPNSLNMHVIRPKSAKGRTRPSLHRPPSSGGCAQGSPSSPPSAIPCETSLNSQKPRACTPKSLPQGTPDEISELLQQQVPIGAASSLNKYPVLPSINRRTPEEEEEEEAVETIAKKAGSLQLSSPWALYHKEARTLKTSEGDLRAQGSCSPGGIPVPRSQKQTGDMEEPSDLEPRLLLAIRSPSGRRFVRHFRPTDNLQTVLAVAERRNGTTYQQCSIETLEVPRRRFFDLTKSLQECRILHKSVLGISQQPGEGWP